MSGSSPTGTVQFKDGSGNLGSAVTLSGAVATLSTSTLGVGTHPITAVYGGDANNSGGTSPTVNQVVNSGAASVSTTIPTLSEWALVLLIGLVLVAAATVIRSRKRR